MPEFFFRGPDFSSRRPYIMETKKIWSGQYFIRMPTTNIVEITGRILQISNPKSIEGETQFAKYGEQNLERHFQTLLQGYYLCRMWQLIVDKILL